MDYDDYLRQQRRWAETVGERPSVAEQAIASVRQQLGIVGERSWRDQVGATSRSLLEEFAQRRGSLLDGVAGGIDVGDFGARASRDAITGFLRNRHAFATRSLGEEIGAHATARALEGRERLLGIASGRLGELTATAALTKQANTTASLMAEMAAARASHWASNIAAHPDLVADILKGTRAQQASIDRLTGAAAGVVRAGELTATSLAHRAFVEATALKMSALGGSLDLFGPTAPTSTAAFDALFGRWRMRSDLPVGFFRDPAERARVYRDAAVDEGLVDAANAEVVDLLVDSGAIAGTRVGGRTRAVVEIGAIRLTVTAGRARHDAFRAIDGFEVGLRRFVAVKLAAACAAAGGDPAKWFTARVPGNIVGDAMRVRRDAYKAGEPKPQPLINFTNLGELIGVITSTRNWDDAFERVFADRDGFKVDLQRLTAYRRPTMHARPIDGLRLAEILLVIRRLTALMEADGDWESGWDDEV